MIGRFGWIAGRDGIGHAVPRRGHVVRAACGAPALEERFAYPETAGHCPRCLQRLGFLPVPEPSPAGRTPEAAVVSAVSFPGRPDAAGEGPGSHHTPEGDAA